MSDRIISASLRRHSSTQTRYRTSRTATATLCGGATAAASATQHLHLVGHDLGRVTVIAVAVLPLAGLQSTLDIDLRALAQVLGDDFR